MQGGSGFALVVLDAFPAVEGADARDDVRGSYQVIADELASEGGEPRLVGGGEDDLAQAVVVTRVTHRFA